MSQMSSELTRFDPSKVSLVDIRRDTERFPRLRSYRLEDAIAAVHPIVTKAFLFKGQTIVEDNIDFIAANLVGELLKDDRFGASNITIEEIARVVNRASLDDEDLVAITVSSLYKVIMKYVKGEGHRADREAAEQARQERLKATQKAAPMVQVYTGKLIRNSKK